MKIGDRAWILLPNTASAPTPLRVEEVRIVSIGSRTICWAILHGCQIYFLGFTDRRRVFLSKAVARERRDDPEMSALGD